MMEPATHFGPYEIIRRLGKSMNSVYLARDTRADRQAALKLIKSGPDTASQMVLEAERRGAAIQQRLHSLDPRVIEVYDYGDLEGYFYIAMQFVEGRNLAEVLRHDGRMSAYRAARIALEICGQLEKFHAFRPGDGAALSVVHGDIKPSNIHLGLNETVRLLDFGIAKSLRPDRDSTFHNFGSPSYCSPERLGRSLVDQQADLWAVGATLYEMVAGAPPYQAEDTRKLERLIQSGRPPRALPASCPAALKAVIGKALAPSARRRYKSAEAFGEDLKAFLEGAETAAESERRGAWKPNPTLESGQASKPKSKPRRWPRASRRRVLRRAGRIASALGCVLAGMVLFIGTSYCSRYWRASRETDLNTRWFSYTDAQAQFGFLGRYSPAEFLRPDLRTAYEKASALALDRRDWERAELYLGRARDLGAADPQIAGKLALARGFRALHGGQRDNARDQLLQAARGSAAIARIHTWVWRESPCWHRSRTRRLPNWPRPSAWAISSARASWRREPKPTAGAPSKSCRPAMCPPRAGISPLPTFRTFFRRACGADLQVCAGPPGPALRTGKPAWTPAAGLESRPTNLCTNIALAMRTTSWQTLPATSAPPHQTPRAPGIFWMAGASFLVAAGLALAYAAKTQNFADVSALLRHGDILNLNDVSSADQLMPSLDVIPDAAERQADAEKLLAFLRAAHPLRNVGTLSRLREQHKPLLPVSRLKPLWVVRTPNEFRRAYLLWSAVYLGGFYLVWFAWRARRASADLAILPALHLLSGIGLDPDGEPARPPARHARIPQIRPGCFSGLPFAAAAAGARVRLPPPGRFHLHAPAGRLRAVRPAAALRHRSRHQRPKGQPGTFSASRSDQDSGGAFPGRILRAQLGAAPRSAPKEVCAGWACRAWRTCCRWPARWQPPSCSSSC